MSSTAGVKDEYHKHKAGSKLETPVFKQDKTLPLVPVNFPLITNAIKGTNKVITFCWFYYL